MTHISSVKSAASNYLIGWHVDTLSNMIQKAKMIALPLIALSALVNVHGAEALGCLGCVICLAGGGCLACVPICVLCGITIPTPLPG